MWNALRTWAAARPLAAITLIAALPRVLAAFFSAGYFALDDHFLVIEAAASWVDGYDYNYWLPWNQQGDPIPGGHNFFYVGIHYLLFLAMKAVGLTDPKVQMVLVRLLHAAWSLVVVRTGYRMALQWAGPAIAWRTGLFLALFYFMPFLSVRNLVEVACIPFLMLGMWRLVRAGDQLTWKDALVAGLWMGLALNVRYQTLFFAAGSGFALLLQRRWWPAVVFGISTFLPVVLFQGGVDLVIWGQPFAELVAYVEHNLSHATTYFDQPWYNYLLLLLGIFIPFFSVAVMFGYFRRARPLLPWLATLVFLAGHSYFPNKQERFLLPIVPLYFVLGYTAWELWRAGSIWWQARPRLWKGALFFTWSVNTLLLVVLTFSYSKRSRVEALYALRGEQDVYGVVVEDTVEGEAPMPALYYWGKWDATVVPWPDAKEDLAAELVKYEPHRRPNAVLFFGLEDLDARIQRVEAAMGPLREVARERPGLVDRAVHWLNPVNRNETIVVMRAH